MRTPSISMTSVECPSQVTRRPDDGRVPHDEVGSTSGSGVDGIRFSSGQRKSRIVGRSTPGFSPVETACVFRNVRPSNRGDARIRSRRWLLVLSWRDGISTRCLRGESVGIALAHADRFAAPETDTGAHWSHGALAAHPLLESLLARRRRLRRSVLREVRRRVLHARLLLRRPSATRRFDVRRTRPVPAHRAGDSHRTVSRARVTAAAGDLRRVDHSARLHHPDSARCGATNRRTWRGRRLARQRAPLRVAIHSARHVSHRFRAGGNCLLSRVTRSPDALARELARRERVPGRLWPVHQVDGIVGARGHSCRLVRRVGKVARRRQTDGGPAGNNASAMRS